MQRFNVMNLLSGGGQPAKKRERNEDFSQRFQQQLESDIARMSRANYIGNSRQVIINELMNQKYPLDEKMLTKLTDLLLESAQLKTPNAHGFLYYGVAMMEFMVISCKRKLKMDEKLMLANKHFILYYTTAITADHFHLDRSAVLFAEYIAEFHSSLANKKVSKDESVSKEHETLKHQLLSHTVVNVSVTANHNPNSASPYYQVPIETLITYAKVLQFKGDHRAAVTILDELVKTNPENPDIADYMFYTGVSYKQLGEYDLANAMFFESSQAGSPKFFSNIEMMTVISRNLEQMKISMGEDTEESADEAYRMVYAQNILEGYISEDVDYDDWISDSTTWRNLGDKCAMHQMYSLATDFYGLSILKDLDAFKKPMLWYKFAKSCYRCGRIPDAQLAVKQALTRSPYNRQLALADAHWSSDQKAFENLINGQLIDLIGVLPFQLTAEDGHLCRLQARMKGFLERTGIKNGYNTRRDLRIKQTAKIGIMLGEKHPIVVTVKTAYSYKISHLIITDMNSQSTRSFKLLNPFIPHREVCEQPRRYKVSLFAAKEAVAGPTEVKTPSSTRSTGRKGDKATFLYIRFTDTDSKEYQYRKVMIKLDDASYDRDSDLGVNFEKLSRQSTEHSGFRARDSMLKSSYFFEIASKKLSGKHNPDAPLVPLLQTTNFCEFGIDSYEKFARSEKVRRKTKMNFASLLSTMKLDEEDASVKAPKEPSGEVELMDYISIVEDVSTVIPKKQRNTPKASVDSSPVDPEPNNADVSHKICVFTNSTKLTIHRQGYYYKGRYFLIQIVNEYDITKLLIQTIDAEIVHSTPTNAATKGLTRGSSVNDLGSSRKMLARTNSMHSTKMSSSKSNIHTYTPKVPKFTASSKESMKISEQIHEMSDETRTSGSSSYLFVFQREHFDRDFPIKKLEAKYKFFFALIEHNPLLKHLFNNAAEAIGNGPDDSVQICTVQNHQCYVNVKPKNVFGALIIVVPNPSSPRASVTRPLLGDYYELLCDRRDLRTVPTVGVPTAAPTPLPYKGQQVKSMKLLGRSTSPSKRDGSPPPKPKRIHTRNVPTPRTTATLHDEMQRETVTLQDFLQGCIQSRSIMMYLGKEVSPEDIQSLTNKPVTSRPAKSKVTIAELPLETPVAPKFVAIEEPKTPAAVERPALEPEISRSKLDIIVERNDSIDPTPVPELVAAPVTVEPVVVPSEPEPVVERLVPGEAVATEPEPTVEAPKSEVVLPVDISVKVEEKAVIEATAEKMSSKLPSVVDEPEPVIKDITQVEPFPLLRSASVESAVVLTDEDMVNLRYGGTLDDDSLVVDEGIPAALPAIQLPESVKTVEQHVLGISPNKEESPSSVRKAPQKQKSAPFMYKSEFKLSDDSIKLSSSQSVATPTAGSVQSISHAATARSVRFDDQQLLDSFEDTINVINKLSGLEPETNILAIPKPEVTKEDHFREERAAIIQQFSVYIVENVIDWCVDSVAEQIMQEKEKECADYYRDYTPVEQAKIGKIINLVMNSITNTWIDSVISEYTNAFIKEEISRDHDREAEIRLEQKKKSEAAAAAAIAKKLSLRKSIADLVLESHENYKVNKIISMVELQKPSAFANGVVPTTPMVNDVLDGSRHMSQENSVLLHSASFTNQVTYNYSHSNPKHRDPFTPTVSVASITGTQESNMIPQKFRPHTSVSSVDHTVNHTIMSNDGMKVHNMTRPQSSPLNQRRQFSAKHLNNIRNLRDPQQQEVFLNANFAYESASDLVAALKSIKPASQLTGEVKTRGAAVVPGSPTLTDALISNNYYSKLYNEASEALLHHSALLDPPHVDHNVDRTKHRPSTALPTTSLFPMEKHREHGVHFQESHGSLQHQRSHNLIDAEALEHITGDKLSTPLGSPKTNSPNLSRPSSPDRVHDITNQLVSTGILDVHGHARHSVMMDSYDHSHVTSGSLFDVTMDMNYTFNKAGQKPPTKHKIGGIVRMSRSRPSTGKDRRGVSVNDSTIFNEDSQLYENLFGSDDENGVKDSPTRSKHHQKHREYYMAKKLAPSANGNVTSINKYNEAAAKTRPKTTPGKRSGSGGEGGTGEKFAVSSRETRRPSLDKNTINDLLYQESLKAFNTIGYVNIRPLPFSAFWKEKIISYLLTFNNNVTLLKKKISMLMRMLKADKNNSTISGSIYTQDNNVVSMVGGGKKLKKELSGTNLVLETNVNHPDSFTNGSNLTVNELIIALVIANGSLGDIVKKLKANGEFLKEIQLVCSVVSVQSIVCLIDGANVLYHGVDEKEAFLPGASIGEFSAEGSVAQLGGGGSSSVVNPSTVLVDNPVVLSLMEDTAPQKAPVLQMLRHPLGAPPPSVVIAPQRNLVAQSPIVQGRASTVAFNRKKVDQPKRSVAEIINNDTSLLPSLSKDGSTASLNNSTSNGSLFNKRPKKTRSASVNDTFIAQYTSSPLFKEFLPMMEEDNNENDDHDNVVDFFDNDKHYRAPANVDTIYEVSAETNNSPFVPSDNVGANKRSARNSAIRSSIDNSSMQMFRQNATSFDFSPAEKMASTKDDLLQFKSNFDKIFSNKVHSDGGSIVGGGGGDTRIAFADDNSSTLMYNPFEDSGSLTSAGPAGVSYVSGIPYQPTKSVDPSAVAPPEGDFDNDSYNNDSFASYGTPVHAPPEFKISPPGSGSPPLVGGAVGSQRNSIGSIDSGVLNNISEPFVKKYATMVQLNTTSNGIADTGGAPMMSARSEVSHHLPPSASRVGGIRSSIDVSGPKERRPSFRMGSRIAELFDEQGPDVEVAVMCRRDAIKAQREEIILRSDKVYLREPVERKAASFSLRKKSIAGNNASLKSALQAVQETHKDVMVHEASEMDEDM